MPTDQNGLFGQGVTRVRAFLHTKFGRRSLVGLTTTAVLFVVNQVTGAWITSVALPWVRDRLSNLLTLPVGVFGLAFFLLLIALTLFAFFDSSPIAEAIAERFSKRRPQKVEPLSKEEAVLVQDHRTIWVRYGKQATGELHNLFISLVAELAEKSFPWAELLQEQGNGLKAGITEMEAGLDSSKGYSIEVVRDRFNKMYHSYLQTIKWTMRTNEHARDLIREGRLHNQLNSWKQAHRAYFDKLVGLDTNPDHRQTMRIYINNPLDTSFTLFLRAIQEPEQG